MNIYWLAVLFYSFLSMKYIETKKSFRIVGGEECDVKDYPFMVSLRTTIRLTHFCGGSLIAKKWVLSAAHCFRQIYLSPWLVTAVMGLSRSDRTDGQVIGVKKIFLHEKFDFKTSSDDIALLLLRYNVKILDGTVRPIYLPAGGELPNSTLMVAGWGATQQLILNVPRYIAPSTQLRCVNVSYITFEECRVYASIATMNHICTFSEEGGKDACKGDSGGPLFHNGVQYGIVSSGIGCAAPRMPSFYTRVDRYLNFINSTMESNGKNCRPIKTSTIFIIVAIMSVEYNNFVAFFLMSIVIIRNVKFYCF